MKSLKSLVIDTNITVHWLMSEKIIDYLIKEFNLTKEFANVYRRRYEPSVIFVNEVLNSKEKRYNFYITELSTNEIFSGIRDEVRSVLLFVKGIPISRWMYKRVTKDVKFKEELSRAIYELAMEGLDVLIENKIEIIPTISPSDAPDYYEVYSSLIFLNPELNTQDAILLTTSIFQEINYFVTLDSDLIKLGKRLKEAYNMEVINPQKAIRMIKR